MLINDINVVLYLKSINFELIGQHDIFNST